MVGDKQCKCSPCGLWMVVLARFARCGFIFFLMWRHLKHKLHYIQLKYEMRIKIWLFWEYGGSFYSVKGLFIADLRENKRVTRFCFVVVVFFSLAERRRDELLETRKVAGLRIFPVFQNNLTNTVDWAVLPFVEDTHTNTHIHTHTHPPPCWILGGATQQVRLYCIRGLLHLQPFPTTEDTNPVRLHLTPLQSHVSSHVLFTWVGLHLANTLLASGGGERREEKGREGKQHFNYFWNNGHGPRHTFWVFE